MSDQQKLKLGQLQVERMPDQQESTCRLDVMKTQADVITVDAIVPFFNNSFSKFICKY